MNQSKLKIDEQINRVQDNKTLDLSYKGLQKFKTIQEELLYIRTLDLSHNHLTEFPDILLTLETIEKIDLSWNHILKFPQHLPEHIVINKAWNRAKSSLDV